MSNEQPAPEDQAAPEMAPQTKGVTVKVLSALDLGPEIEGMTGRQLRMRMVTIEPGGVFGPLHDHKDRPGMVYILQGTITDHRNGIATNYGPGAGWPEDKDTLHWLENRGTTVAVEISVDIFRQP
jgi:quercetin dioxygenase-like cupin family protein